MRGPGSSRVRRMQQALLAAGLVGFLTPGRPLAGAQEKPTGHLTAEASATQASSATDEEVATGKTFLSQRRYGEAMGRFELALGSAPKNQAARDGEVAAATAWALAEIRRKQADKGMEILERALVQVPDDPELLLDFGVEATALGQFPIAEQALQAADKLRPHHPKTVYGMARLEIERQHWPEAERDLKAYLQLQPQDASAYFGLGHVYAVQQRQEEARVAFQRSVELQPMQTESYYQLGELDLETHKDADAQVSFGKVLERDATHAGALTGMGELALRAKNYSKAEEYLAAAEKSDPAYQTPHYFRGLALAKLGRKQEAEEEMRLGDSRLHATKPGEDGTGGEAQPAPGQQPPHSR